VRQFGVRGQEVLQRGHVAGVDGGYCLLKERVEHLGVILLPHGFLSARMLPKTVHLLTRLPPVLPENGASGIDPRHGLAVPYHEGAVHQNVIHPLGER
jgi:hypothetical protein